MNTDVETHIVPEELIEYIKSGCKFIIAGHKEPDGDCVGSQLALSSALSRLGKKTIVCSEGPFKRTEIRDFPNQFKQSLTEEEKKDARVIIVDCSSMERTGVIMEYIEGLPCAIIDHHAAVTHSKSTAQAPVFVDPDAPSCTFLIEKVINALALDLTEEEATLLFFGLCTDTGFFRHLTDKNHEVFKSAARMVYRGANPKNVYSIMNGGKSYDSRILMGNILSRTEQYFNGRLLVSHESLEEFQKYGFEGRDSDSINKMLQSIDGVEATVIIRQECADNCTVSLRSTDKIDVSIIAASFGGGGHKNASGLTMEGSISSVKEKIIESFLKVFKS